MAKLNVRYVTFALVILCLATISKSEYVWNGKEWIWKESVTESNDGSGDGTLSDGKDLEESTIMSEDNEKNLPGLK